MKRLCAAGCCVFTLVLADVALAEGGEDARRAARRAFEEADAAYARGDFRSAASAYELAARIEMHATPLLSAADAWERAGEPIVALEACDRAATIKTLSDADRKDIDSCIARFQAVAVTVELSGGATTTFTVPGRPPISSEGVVRLAAGRQEIFVRDPITQLSKTVTFTGRAGERCAVRAAQRKIAAPSQAPVWVALGVGAASVVVGAWAGAHLLSIHGAESRSPSDVADFNHRYVPIFDAAVAGFAASALAGGYLTMRSNLPRRESFVTTSCKDLR